MSEWIALLLSYLFIFVVIGIAQTLLALRVVDPEGSRKIIHIGVAHWWFIAAAGISTTWIAMIAPVSFIILNYLSERFSLVKAMDDGTGKNWGTVYFPISLSVIVLATWSGYLPFWIGGSAILVLGWADGMASVVGRAVGKGWITLFGNRKSYVGSGVFLLFAMIVIGAFMNAALGRIDLVPLLLTAVMATLVEAMTPLGLDNLSVPAVTALLLSGLQA